MQKKLGKMNIFIYVSIDLKRRIKEDILFVMKAKTPTLNVQLKRIHSRFFKPYKCFTELKIEKISKT